MAAAKRNRKGQFVKGARRSTRKRPRRPASASLFTRARAAAAGLFRRKPKRRRAENPRLTVGQARRLVALRGAADRHLRVGSLGSFQARALAQHRLSRYQRKPAARAATRLLTPTETARYSALQKALDRRLRTSKARRQRGAWPKKYTGAIPKLQGAQARLERIAGRPLTAAERARRKHTNPRKKRKPRTMAQLARNSKGRFLKRGHGRRRSVKVANPRRRRRRHLVAAAPRRRRHHARRRSHARRAHNPMGGGLIRTAKASLMPMALGGLGGAAAGYVDAKFLGAQPTVSILLKIFTAIAGAAVIGRRHPLAAAGWSGGLIGATGYYAGIKMGGGLVALNKKAALAGLADMAADDPDLAAQIAGLGDVVNDMGDDAALGDAANDYNEALSDAEDMADVVDDS